MSSIPTGEAHVLDSVNVVQFINAYRDAGKELVLWLLAHHPTMANEVLALAFDVTVHKVGDVYEEGDYPPDEKDKWFVATLAYDGCVEDAARIPLANSKDEAYALAVKHLKLRERYLKINDPVDLVLRAA